MITKVIISKYAKKQILKLPRYIIEKLTAWVESVEKEGLMEVRKISGFHDEPLKGDRVGERSIRLSRSYRAIYVIKENNQVEFVSVEEVNKHDY